MSNKNTDTPASAGVGIDAYFRAVAELQQRVLETQRPVLAQVAGKMADVILAGGRVFVFGTGHSHMLAEEGYARAGGLLSVVPIFYTALMLHESVPLSAKVERTPGLAPGLLDRSGITARRHAVRLLQQRREPVAGRDGGRGEEARITTVTVGSIAFAQIAPLSALENGSPMSATFRSTTAAFPATASSACRASIRRSGPPRRSLARRSGTPWSSRRTYLLQIAKGDAPVAVSFNMPNYAEYSGCSSEEKDLQPGADGSVNMQDLAIGVDLGATKIATALVARDGRCSHLGTRPRCPPTAASKGLASGLRMKSAHPGDVRRLTRLGVGIGSAGLVDAEAGVVRWALNLGWRDVPLAPEVARKLDNKIRVFADNDANANVLGEGFFGSARDCRHLRPVHDRLGPRLRPGARQPARQRHARHGIEPRTLRPRSRRWLALPLRPSRMR
jgi:hypothetical protein